jgi:hypothetical protein
MFPSDQGDTTMRDRLAVAMALVAAVLSCGTVWGQERGVQDECSPHSKLRSVALSDVRWTDGFWADRFTQAREVTIPTMWKYFQGETRSIGIDRDEASLPMRGRLTEANPLVEELRNQVAVERGPIVYCLESHDLPEGVAVSDILIPSNIRLAERFDETFRATVLEGRALRRPARDWNRSLYGSVESQELETVSIRLIPYYCWNNRGVSEMTVWMPVVWTVAKDEGSER